MRHTGSQARLEKHPVAGDTQCAHSFSKRSWLTEPAKQLIFQALYSPGRIGHRGFVGYDHPPALPFAQDD
jgi:hypothetical protein